METPRGMPAQVASGLRVAVRVRVSLLVFLPAFAALGGTPKFVDVLMRLG